LLTLLAAMEPSVSPRRARFALMPAAVVLAPGAMPPLPCTRAAKEAAVTLPLLSLLALLVSLMLWTPPAGAGGPPAQHQGRAAGTGRLAGGGAGWPASAQEHQLTGQLVTSSAAQRVGPSLLLSLQPSGNRHCPLQDDCSDSSNDGPTS